MGTESQTEEVESHCSTMAAVGTLGMTIILSGYITECDSTDDNKNRALSTCFNNKRQLQGNPSLQ